MDKLNYWMNKDNTLILVEIDMTNYCNHNCPACTGFKDNKVSITLDEAKNYIDQMKKMDVRAIAFTGGGDPLMNPDTINAIRYAKRQGLDVALITNGLALDSLKKCEVVVRSCTWCRISLDAATPETYKKTHGMNEEAFLKVQENLKRLVEVRNDSGLTKDHCTIGTAFLTSEMTKHEVYDFAKLSKDLGVDYAQMRPFHWDKTDVLDEIDRCKDLNDDNFKVLSSIHKYQFFKDEKIRTYDKCHGANFRTVICADSKVYMCCHWRSNPEYCLGDLKKDKLIDIWKRREQMIQKVDVSKCLPFCVLDKINRELHNMKIERTHLNFI
jgi:MoaA/NifB/PqqE/SkfB family radical SAM enzyme